MKNILSFFVAFLLFGGNITLYCSEKEQSIDSLFVTGVQFNSSFFKGKMYAEYETPQEETTSNVLKTWSAQLQPFDFLRLSAGSLSYSGLWSKFNNPAPSTIYPLKNEYTIQKKLITSTPSKTTSERTPSIALEIQFPHFLLTTFTSLDFEGDLFAGSGISIPFGAQYGKETSVQGSISTAWKMVSHHPKTSDTWFLTQKYFEENIYHTFIQDFSVKYNTSTFLLNTGFTQMPHGKPAGFLRGEYSFSYKPFFLNAQFFLCDINYLGQNGSYKLDTLQMALNPQLHFLQYAGLIRSFKIGFTAKGELQNEEALHRESLFFLFFDIATEVKLLFLTVTASAGISELQIAEQKTIQMQEESPISLKTSFKFYPWYLKAIARSWHLQCQYETHPLKKERSDTFDTSINFLYFIPQNDWLKSRITIFSENIIKLNNEEKSQSYAYGIKTYSQIQVSVLKKKQSISINSEIKARKTYDSFKIIETVLSAELSL